MTTQYRPNLLRRLLAWRARPLQHDPADMGTDIGLEFFLAQTSGQRAGGTAEPGQATARPWQGWPH